MSNPEYSFLNEHSQSIRKMGKIPRPMTKQSKIPHPPSETSVQLLAQDAARRILVEGKAHNSSIAKAERLETLMMDGIEVKIKTSWLGDVSAQEAPGLPDGRFLIGDDPRLPLMPPKPTLKDFYQLRVALHPTGYQHMLQSAQRAASHGCSEQVILACLLHDLAVTNLIRSDHGYWAAQMIAPYVDPQVAWTVQNHQALRYFAAPIYGYDYPAFYKQVFGEEFVPPEYLARAHQKAQAHPWYDSAMQVVVNDFYAFDGSITVEFERFEGIIAKHFKQPEQGLGFDDSPSAHMWRTMIWPNNFL